MTIYFIFKKIKSKQKLDTIQLNICRDFSGNEDNIKQQLNHLLGKKLEFTPSIIFVKLPKESYANKYAFLIRKDTLQKFKALYIEIKLEEFEEYLKRK